MIKGIVRPPRNAYHEGQLGSIYIIKDKKSSDTNKKSTFAQIMMFLMKARISNYHCSLLEAMENM